MSGVGVCGPNGGDGGACGPHGSAVEVVDESGERCECVCDEGWTSMQGGDVLLLAPGGGGIDAGAQCSVESAQHRGGSVSPTISPRLPGSGGGGGASSSLGFLEVRGAPRVGRRSACGERGAQSLTRAHRPQDLSWPSLIGALGSVVIAAILLRYAAARFGLCDGVCGKRDGEEEGSPSGRARRARADAGEPGTPPVTATHIHINLSPSPLSPADIAERFAVTPPPVAGIPAARRDLFGAGGCGSAERTPASQGKKGGHGGGGREGGSKKKRDYRPASR